ncbi:putative PDDEXK endonuclease [Dethiosulfovibrio salsuginis]|uniref:Uncharacterized protein n=1 Tax=Dethiosulfovibrio salsuginis TaxID=561720 RepID=A0A1X7KYU6_9BACT|nr:hypothetical protein [Dethiosulfovibrio salsuginis]SMG46527.1 hypothetical protein SAMN06275492_14010 [Dethiosulfovibrio salsuginis]
MPAKNKIRGNYFETKVVKILQGHFGLNDHECHRAQSSGNFRTEYGDIYFKDQERHPLIVECKYRKEISLDWFFPDFNPEVLSWVDQTRESEKKFKANFPSLSFLSILIAARPNQRDWYVVILNNSLNMPVPAKKFVVDGYEITTMSNLLKSLPKEF